MKQEMANCLHRRQRDPAVKSFPVVTSPLCWLWTKQVSPILGKGKTILSGNSFSGKGEEVVVFNEIKLRSLVSTFAFSQYTSVLWVPPLGLEELNWTKLENGSQDAFHLFQKK